MTWLTYLLPKASQLVTNHLSALCLPHKLQYCICGTGHLMSDVTTMDKQEEKSSLVCGSVEKLKPTLNLASALEDFHIKGSNHFSLPASCQIHD